MGPTTAEIEEVRQRLADPAEMPFYARHALKIVDVNQKTVPLVGKPAQLEFDRVLAEQHNAGLPMRAIVLKARKLGFSTWTQGKMIQHTTQQQNRRAIVVAHDEDTSEILFDIGYTMYQNLPAELKPPLKYGQKGEEMVFGERSRMSVAQHPGLNSRIAVTTAGSFEGGRGDTIHDIHGSEVAFWPNIGKKLLAIQNAVPDVHGTMIILESTANGHNGFKELWDDAVAGENDYAPVFFAWHDEPSYVRPFLNEQDRERFEDSIGDLPYGEDEPELIELLEDKEMSHLEILTRLNWRRWCIANKCGKDVDKFHQEYPSTPDEAFLATGKHVFKPKFVQVVLDRCDLTDPRVPTKAKPGPERGLLVPQKFHKAGSDTKPIVIPREPLWTPRQGRPKPGTVYWDVWEHPILPDPEDPDDQTPPGQYVMGVDVSGGQVEAEGSDPAYHAVTVIDHRTRLQVGRYVSRIDPDDFALIVYLGALYWNNAWVAVETTGGWGLPVARILRRDFRYPWMYYRKKVDRAQHDKREDRLGWDTNPQTKPLIEANAVALVREATDGIRSRSLATQMLTYVRDDRGRTGPEPGRYADELLSWMIAQYVANEAHLRRDPLRKRSKRTSYTGQRDPVTGY